MTTTLAELLEISTSRHSHLCPRQVLGVRMGLAALEAIGITAPISKETGLVILETDGCFADGVQAATGAWVGHRSLRVEDLGKIAATFVNVKTGQALRYSPRQEARIRARLYAPNEDRRYFAQLVGYQVMPDNELFRVQTVILDPPLERILSKPGARVVCEMCGEEIINEREIIVGGTVVCRTCAQGSYYVSIPERQPVTAHLHRSRFQRGENTAVSAALSNNLR